MRRGVPLLLSLVALLAVSCDRQPFEPQTDSVPTPSTPVLSSTGCTVAFTGTTAFSADHFSHGNNFTACMDGVLTGIEIEYGDSPCTAGFTATTSQTSGHTSHGNVFRPCATGEITQIEIEYWGEAVTGRTLQIYQGEYTSGDTPIYTQTGIALDGGEDWDVITLSGPITVQTLYEYTFIVDVWSPVRHACMLTDGGGVFSGTVNDNCSIGYRVHITTADATGLTLELFNGGSVGGSAAYTQTGVTLDGSYGFDAIPLSTPFPVANGSLYTFLIDAPSPVGYRCQAGGFTDHAFFSDMPANSCSVGFRAHFAPAVTTIAIDLDVKPGSDPNCLNAQKGGRLPVAILGTDVFDPAQVDPATIRLEGLAPLRWSLDEDVDGDGHLDYVFHFDQRALDVTGVVDPAGKLLTLTGNLRAEFGATPIEGSDTIHIAGDVICETYDDAPGAG